MTPSLFVSNPVAVLPAGASEHGNHIRFCWFAYSRFNRCRLFSVAAGALILAAAAFFFEAIFHVFIWLMSGGYSGAESLR